MNVSISLILVGCTIPTTSSESIPPLTARNTSTEIIPKASPSSRPPILVRPTEKLPSPIPPILTPELAATPPLPVISDTPQPTAIITPTFITPTITSEAAGWSSDLLYLSDEKLMRWDPVANNVIQLAENVISYSVSANGKKAALLQSQKIAANGNELFDLTSLDLITNQSVIVNQSISRLSGITISPDSQWLAYIVPGLLLNNEASLYRISLVDPEPPELIGVCIPVSPSICETPVWNSDSQSILWSDMRGIWLANLKDTQAQNVITNIVQVTDPKGLQTDIQVMYHSLKWRSNGRYVIATVVPSSSGTSWKALIDLSTGRMAEIPDTYNLPAEAVSTRWLPDGSFIVGHRGQTKPGDLPFLTIYLPAPTRGDLMTVQRRLQFHLSDMPDESSGIPESVTYTPSWIAQFDEEYIYLALIPTPPENNSNFIEINLKENIYQSITQIPSRVEGVLWSPDHRGVLVIVTNKQFLYISLKNRATIEIQSISGSQAQDFLWLPPTLH